MHPVLTRNFEIFPALDWLAALTAHIPNQGEHLVRDSGWDRTISRGKRKQAQEQGQAPASEGILEVPPPPGSCALKQRWAQFIKKVYEADLLRCPRCGVYADYRRDLPDLNIRVFQGASHCGRNITRIGIPRGLLGILHWRGTS